MFFLISSVFYLILCGYITFISGERMALATFLLAMTIGLLILKNYRIVILISLFILLIVTLITYNTHSHYKDYKIIESNAGHLGLVVEKFDNKCVDSLNCSKILKLQPSF